ncbi:uncharacterized protein LOC117173210 [Belonocnema kinseyi]|uniref:uncharacterized protein LOC117173210 n=1 Tax=Belonocnema kinseyi TaxID=2817044 RepID=UPI00143D578C|nr:uncharacterized protein LOC117173210 [Belonocnema kinseyi]
MLKTERTSKKPASIVNFFKKQSLSNTDTSFHKKSIPSNAGADVSLVEGSPYVVQIENTEKVTEASSVSSDFSKKVRRTPVQDEISKKIASLRVDLLTVIQKQEAGLDSDSLGNEIKKLKAEISKNKGNLDSLKNNARRQKQFKDQRKNALKRVCENHPDIAEKTLKIHETTGRPRLEVNQPDLMKTIIQLATFGASAEEKSGSEALNSCRTLPELCEELKIFGYNISKSAAYLRLLPRNSKTIEGRKHVKNIRLPDHDCVVAERHTLIPSVYALIIGKPNEMGRPDAVTYSGPTYIAIRSGKHALSTASTHSKDFERLLKWTYLVN